ncbi:4'-phosphopantetheinyl transferase superfamily protein [Haloarcula marina]|uniref:4'-phosphopantetheinyl transferase superfamily protein n=1 Tax=Haloarcula marina TaxID=2961574 RepID=UPI0020B8D098|nr:4'-phosphopantetheinyl transferase superfamily protein [Halomicroarcula marina]
MTLADHKTKSALERLLPHVEVTGGSFSNDLPPLDQLSAKRARLKLRAARAEARKTALTDLTDHFDSGEQYSIKETAEGYREWPEGYTGSLTHKGPILLAAVVESRFTESLGIDLEFNSEGGKGLSHVVNEGENPDHIGSKPTALGIFSTKESIYKAYYPLMESDLGFDDVQIEWTESSAFLDRGIARCPDSTEFKIQCLYLNEWIVSAAQLEGNK